MNVLMVTGDRRFGPGHSRYEMQKSAVGRLDVLFWGKGSVCPRLPDEAYDVVTSQDPFLRGLFSWYAARRFKARLNVQVHADLSVQTWWKRALARLVLRRADSVRVVSERGKKQVLCLAPRAQVAVLPVYVDLERFRALSRAPEHNLVLWVGRFEPEKDPLAALDVVRQVPGARLVMLGAGSLEQTLKEQAKGMDVTFPGWKDIADYVSMASVVLCTSRAESWVASIIEALAAGVPVVSLDVGIAREAGAIVVPRENLARALADVLETNPQGALTVPILSKDDWVRAWVASFA